MKVLAECFIQCVTQSHCLAASVRISVVSNIYMIFVSCKMCYKMCNLMLILYLIFYINLG